MAKPVHLLVSNAGSFVTYRSNVRSAIKRIRNKFCACAPAFDEIENYSGFGYGWRKPVV